MTSTLMVVHTVAPSSSPLDFGATRRAIRLDTGADVESMTIGTLIFVSWAAALFVGLAKIQIGHTHWMLVLGLAWLVEYLYMGLFITAHDAMHGIVCRRNPRLNRWIGRVLVACYAWFDYDVLHTKHWQHHRHAGKVHHDPDFHKGNPSVLPWFVSFMTSYMTFKQLAYITAQTITLLIVGAPLFNVLLFTAICPIASAAQLFYYGTYVPHRPAVAGMGGGGGAEKLLGEGVGKQGKQVSQLDWPEERSRSSDAPAWLTMLQCYNFGLHLEHHLWPAVPWYRLPAARRQLQMHRKMHSGEPRSAVGGFGGAVHSHPIADVYGYPVD